MFGTLHIIMLVVCTIYIVVAVLLLKKFKTPLKYVLRGLLIIGIFSETIKTFTYILMNEDKLGGFLPKTDLPFHLCSIQLIFFLILNLSESPKVRQTLFSFMLPTCLIGGIAALLIPTSSSLNMWMITIQYFLYHASIIIYAINLIHSDEVKFTINDYFRTLAMMYCIFILAIYLNSWVNDYVNNINFMYVVNPPVSGLPFLNKDHGWLVYIVHYASLAFFMLTICYIKPIINKVKGKR